MEQPILFPLLLLALVGGYFFIIKWERTRYEVPRQDGRHLYFRAAGYGVYVAIGSLLVLVIFRTGVELASRTYPIGLLTALAAMEFSDLLVLALLISPISGSVFARLLNRLTDESVYFDRAIQENELEFRILDAISNNQMIMVTLEERKVYVGFPVRNSDPAKSERKYIPLLPVMSGARDAKGLVKFTTFYEDVLLATGSDLNHLEPEDFVLVLPVSKISSLRKFDSQAYAKFLEGNASAATSRSVT